MEGYMGKDRRIQGEGWKDTGGRMEGYRGKDGRIQGGGYRNLISRFDLN